jgi:hypothetical protein
MRGMQILLKERMGCFQCSAGPKDVSRFGDLRSARGHQPADTTDRHPA